MALVQKAFSDIITFSRSSNATRIGPTGLVEYAPHNLLTYSEQFDDASWNKSNVSVTANAIAAPDGTVTADTLTENTANQEHFTNQQTSKAAANISYTFSVYVKRGTSGTRNVVVAMTDGISGGYEAVFDPDDGAILIASRGIGVTTGWTAGAATATNAGNGWWRFTFSAVSNTSTRIDGVVYIADGTTKSYTGNGSSNLFLWGAQLAVGPYALDYTPTTSAVVYGPRFDFDPVTLAARGLLVEEQRTNLLTYSEQLDNAAWIKSSTTVTANAAAAPDGTVTADLVTWSGSSEIAQISAATNGTLSFWAKGVAGQTLFVGIAGTSATTTITLSDSWQRYSLSFTGTSTYIYFGKYSGATVTSAYLWGAQLEAGSFATSYIPTIASTVTRSADVASVDTLSPWFNATEGTLFAEWDMQDATGAGVNYGINSLNDGTTTNEMLIYKSSGGAPPDARFATIVSGSLQGDLDSGLNLADNVIYKIASAYKLNDFAVSAAGLPAVPDSVPQVPSVTNLQIGASRFAPLFNGHIRRIAFYPRRLTNAELQALSA